MFINYIILDLVERFSLQYIWKIVYVFQSHCILPVSNGLSLYLSVYLSIYPSIIQINKTKLVMHAHDLESPHKCEHFLKPYSIER